MKVVRLRQRKVYQFEQVQSSHTYHPTDIHSPLPELSEAAGSVGAGPRLLSVFSVCHAVKNISHFSSRYFLLVAPAGYDL